MDPRPVGRDGRPYGPVPRGWAKYRGLFHHGRRTILSYSVGGAAILECPGVLVEGDTQLYSRTLSIGPAAHKLSARIAPASLNVALVGKELDGVHWQADGGFQVLNVPARAGTLRLKVLVSTKPIEAERDLSVEDLAELTHGSAPRWPERVKTPLRTLHDEVFTVDEITLPTANPWNCQVRATGHDFFADEKRAAVCTWDGDVWIVEGVDQDEG